MKTIKTLLVLAVIAFAGLKATAQSPAIKDLRDVIASSSTKFSALKGEKISEEDGAQSYKSKKEHAGATTFIMDKAGGQIMYYIVYKLDPSNAMMFKIQSILLDQYITEINDMIKTGKYDGKDGQEDGDATTTVTDKQGDKVLVLLSNPKYYALIVY